MTFDNLIKFPPYTQIPRPCIVRAIAAAQGEGVLFPTCNAQFIPRLVKLMTEIPTVVSPEVMHELLLLPIPLVEVADVPLEVLLEEGNEMRP